MTTKKIGKLCPTKTGIILLVQEGYCFNRCEMVGTSNIIPVSVGHKLPPFVHVNVEENPRFVIITFVVCPEVAVDPN
jgi:hypothetical protein